MGDVSPTVLTSWLEAAQAGSPAAAFNLGLYFDDRKQFDLAKKWYGFAAEHGDVDAAVNLGLLYSHESDFGAAAPWFEIGVAHGRPDAMHMLGIALVQSGRLEDGVALWVRAAELGHVVAARKVGMVFAQVGDGKTAEIFLRQAAAAGNTEAMTALAEHLRGCGRVEEAARWDERASG